MRSLRTLSAFLIGPIAPTLLLLAIGAALLGELDAANIGRWLQTTGTLTYPFALFFGVPTYIFLKLIGWNGIAAYVLSGIVFGVAAFLLMHLFMGARLNFFALPFLVV